MQIDSAADRTLGWGKVLEGSDLGVWDCELGTGERTYSARCAAIFGYDAIAGYDRSEAPARTTLWENVLYPEDAARVLQVWNEHLHGLTPAYEAEYRVRHGDGKLVWVRDRGRVYQRSGEGVALRAGGVTEDITIHKESLDELRLLRERFAHTAELTTRILWTAGPDGSILSYEPVWERFSGLSDSSALNEAWAAAIHPEDRHPVLHRWRECLRTGDPYRIEHRLRRFDGVYRYAETRAQAHRGADGNIRIWYGSTEDIHDRVAAQRSLEASEARLELALDGAELATWDWNLRTGEVLRSARWFRLLGYEAPGGAISAEFWQEQVHPQDRAAVQSAWMAHLAGTTASYTSEFRIRHRSGAWRWMATHGRVMERDDHGPLRACGVNQDITERRRTEEALQKSERFSRVLLEANEDCQSLLNPAGEVEYMNPAGRRRMGRPPAEGVQKERWLHFWQPADHAALSGAMERAFTGRSVAIQARGTTENAAGGWWDILFSPLWEDAGQSRRILASAREITEMRDREEKQRALTEKDRLQAIVENLNEGILIGEPGGEVLLMNRAARKMYGFDASGLPCEQLFEKLDARNLAGLAFTRTERPLARALRGEPFEGLEAFFHNRVSGREWIGSCGSSPVRSATGALVLAVLSVREITEEKKAADELLQTNETLHALSGQLLRLQDEERRRIARDLHDGTVQVLAAEMMNLKLLARSPAIQQLEFERDLIAKTLVMARQSVTELRTLSYLLHPPALEQLGLVAALRSWIDGFSERTGIPVDVEVEETNIRLGDDAETALFRITQEALANVHRHSGATTATVRLRLQDGYLEMEIRDDGKGFNADNRAGEEAPRFGVGLPGMQERARQLGGAMRVSSGPRGTIIYVRLPRTELNA